MPAGKERDRGQEAGRAWAMGEVSLLPGAAAAVGPTDRMKVRYGQHQEG